MKIYRFYVDKIKSAFVDFTEEEFKQMPEIDITFASEDSNNDKTFKGKQLRCAGYKENYVIITPLENFEERE